MQNKRHEFHLIGVADIEQVDSSTKAVLMNSGSSEISLIGEGINDDGKRETLCVDVYENSIWLKDHKDQNPKKKTIRTMDFVGGVSFLYDADEKELEMVKRWSANKSVEGIPNSKKLFTYVDTKSIAEESMKKEVSLIEAKNFCYKGSISELHAFASYKDIEINQFNTDKEFRHYLASKLNADTADRFLEELKSDRVKYQYQIKIALETNEIMADTRSQQVVWGTSGNPIISYKGQNMIDAIVNHALSKEGALFYQTLTAGKEVDESKKAKIKTSSSINLSVEDMVNMAIEDELLLPNAEGQFYFGGSKCGSDVESVIKHISDRPKKVEDLKQLLKL